MLFEETKEAPLKKSSNSDSLISNFHSKIAGKNLINSILIPNFYLEFEELLKNLISQILKKEIDDFGNIDFLKLSANENGNILMEDWKIALEFCGKTAMLGNFKFLVIQNIDSISLNIANALLKVLEEPPKGTFILLSYTNKKNILPTIRSRCIVLDLKNNQENFNFFYEEFIKVPEYKKQIQDLCFCNLSLLSMFKSPDSFKLLTSIQSLTQNFSYVNFKNFFNQNSSKRFFEEICFLFIESTLTNNLKNNNKILSFYNFYFNKKYVKLYNISSESFLYYTFYYICKNL